MKRTWFAALLILQLVLAASSLSLAAPQDYQTEEDILYRDSAEAEKDAYIGERCRLDLYYPASQGAFATVVWFHGGGLRGGGKSIPEALQNQGIAIAAANYRLHPQVKSPVYVEDAAAVVAWVFKNIEKYGGDPNKIFVSGHSAGGYLTSMIGLDKRYLAKHQIDANRIAGLIPFSGHTITHFTVRTERGIPDYQAIVDEMAPLYHVRKDAPPLALITGDRNLEMLGRYEENLYLWRMMQVAGHEQTSIYEIQGYNHGGMAQPAFPLLLKEIRRVLQLRD